MATLQHVVERLSTSNTTLDPWEFEEYTTHAATAAPPAAMAFQLRLRTILVGKMRSDLITSTRRLCTQSRDRSQSRTQSSSAASSAVAAWSPDQHARYVAKAQKLVSAPPPALDWAPSLPDVGARLASAQEVAEGWEVPAPEPAPLFDQWLECQGRVPVGQVSKEWLTAHAAFEAVLSENPAAPASAADASVAPAPAPLPLPLPGMLEGESATDLLAPPLPESDLPCPIDVVILPTLATRLAELGSRAQTPAPLPTLSALPAPAATTTPQRAARPKFVPAGALCAEAAAGAPPPALLPLMARARSLLEAAPRPAAPPAPPAPAPPPAIDLGASVDSEAGWAASAAVLGLGVGKGSGGLMLGRGGADTVGHWALGAARGWWEGWGELQVPLGTMLGETVVEQQLRTQELFLPSQPTQYSQNPALTMPPAPAPAAAPATAPLLPALPLSLAVPSARACIVHDHGTLDSVHENLPTNDLYAYPTRSDAIFALVFALTGLNREGGGQWVWDGNETLKVD